MTFEIREECKISLFEQTFHLPRLVLNPGEIVGVVGPSRARVDILLRLLAASLPPDGGLLPPAPGRVRARKSVLSLTSLPFYIDNSQLYADKQIYKKIGSIYSEPDLNILGRTVLEDYLSALVAVDAPPQQQVALVLLRHFGLSEKLMRRTEVLSGGEKQRLNCATALAGNRKVLVGDFTSATLDRDFRDFMCRTAELFAQSGGLVILAGMTPHNPNSIKYSRWLELEPREGGANLREVDSVEPYNWMWEEEARELKALLAEREINDLYVLTADGVYRRGITQPLSLSIKAGEIVIITGPNGVGKSTFGQIVIRQIKKREMIGSVELAEGVEPVMAPQSPSEMILGLDLANELPDRQLREICGLASERDNSLDPRGFSHGTQKLIGIANALRLSKGLAILDEPTSGMDFHQKKRFVELLNHFNQLAILIITHDPSVESLGRLVELKEYI